jgi:hypothetical protein
LPTYAYRANKLIDILNIPPVLDERDVRECLRGGGGHREMIPLHKEISWYIILEESMVEDG